MTPQLLLPGPTTKVEVCTTIHEALQAYNNMKDLGLKPRISCPVGSADYIVIGTLWTGSKSPEEPSIEVLTSFVEEK